MLYRNLFAVKEGKKECLCFLPHNPYFPEAIFINYYFHWGFFVVFFFSFHFFPLQYMRYTCVHTHIRHTNNSSRLIFYCRPRYCPHSWADKSALIIILRPRHSRNLAKSQAYKIPHNPTPNEYSIPSQESKAVSPNSLWLAAIWGLFLPLNIETTPLEI